jgi:hypothetical protein
MLSMVPFLLAAAAPVAIPPQAALTEVISARDAELFELFFQGCDPDRLRTMLAPDVEFYHDKDGFVFRSADEFVAGYAKSCEGRKAPDAWRSRRELVTASLTVDPVPGFGAMEVGEHLFYERKGDGPEKLAGRARFAMVWKLDGGAWKLARILSYGHRPAAATKP